MLCLIQHHRGRRLALVRPTPSPPSSSPDERTNDGLHSAIHGRMTTTPVVLTAAQIRQNALEDACEYHDERIDKLTNQLGAAYSRTFMHTAMISH